MKTTAKAKKTDTERISAVLAEANLGKEQTAALLNRASLRLEAVQQPSEPSQALLRAAEAKGIQVLGLVEDEDAEPMTLADFVEDEVTRGPSMNRRAQRPYLVQIRRAKRKQQFIEDDVHVETLKMSRPDKSKKNWRGTQ